VHRLMNGEMLEEYDTRSLMQIFTNILDVCSFSIHLTSVLKSITEDGEVCCRIKSEVGGYGG
jgi:hypothetical protein